MEPNSVFPNSPLPLVDAIHVRSRLHESACRPNSAKHFEIILFSAVGKPGGAAPFLGRVFHSPLAAFSTSPKNARTRLTGCCSRFTDFGNGCLVDTCVQLDHESPMLEVFCSTALLAAPARTPIRCAIYTRQSVEPSTDLSSCQVQFDLCSAYVQSLRALGLELIAERFDDEGYSGTTLDRPAFQRLLDVIRSGGIDRLVIYRLDRLSRNLRHFVTLFEELRAHNVTLDIVTAQGLGTAALDKLMLTVLASFAEFERDLAASRIAEGRARLKAHGRRIAGAVPFGYEADPRTKQLGVCNEEAQAVIRMFQTCLRS